MDEVNPPCVHLKEISGGQGSIFLHPAAPFFSSYRAGLRFAHPGLSHDTFRMKKNPLIAFLLSFFIAGAGLAYLGKWKPAVINFVVVVGIITAAVLLLSPEWWGKVGNFISFGLAGGSGAMAMGAAKAQNESLGA